jgi:hypothetical protein
MKNLFWVRWSLIPFFIAVIVACTPAPPAAGDPDKDGISTSDEQAGWEVVISRAGTQLSTRKVTSDPTKADTDNDGLNDGLERSKFIDPNSDDTDADLLKDADEVNTWVSNPADVDTDKDSEGNSGLFDGNEIATYGTSPTLADSDGDFFSDYQEALTLGNLFKPLIANTPRFELEFASVPSMSLKIVKTSDQSVVDTKTSSLAFGTSSSNSSTDTNTERSSAEVSVTVGVEVETGIDGGATFSGSYTATAGYGTENTKSFTSESGRSTQQTAESARTASSTQGQQIGGGTMTVGFKIKNTGDVAFTLSNLAISVLRRDPNDLTKFKFVGSMIPNLGSNTPPSITLGKGITSGSLGATLEFTDASELLEIMKYPAGLRFELAGYDLKDSADKNFAFQNDVTNGQTAQVVVDYGNGNVVRQRVATNVERVGGKIVGVKLGKALKDILELPYTTTTDAVSSLKVINGVTDKKLGLMIQSKTVADPKSLWVVIGSNGLTMTGVNVEDILIKSGTEVRLMLVRDVDGDKLIESEEYFHGTSDTTKDSDSDGLDDFAEVRTGWTVTVKSIIRKVFSNPKVLDSDGDKLDDAGEKTKGSDPFNSDTDGDGLTDDVDDNPTDTATFPVISNFIVNVPVSGKNVSLTANVANPSLKDSVIEWGDGTPNTVLTGAAAKTINMNHTYAASGPYTVKLTASDTSPTPKSTVVTKLINVIDISSNLLADFRFNGAVGSSVSGGAVTGSVEQQGTCVTSTNGFNNLGATAYQFNVGNGCGNANSSGSVSVNNFVIPTQMSFTAWFNPTNNIANNWIIGASDGTGNVIGARMFINANQKAAFILPITGNQTITVTDTQTTITAGTWYHYAASVSLAGNTTTVNLYKSGNLVATASGNGTASFANATQLLIGNQKLGSSSGGGSNTFSGVIDNTRVYGRALNAVEAKAIFDLTEN